MKLDHCFTSHTRINSKWIKDLNVTPETIKNVEQNIGSKTSDIAHSNMLLDIFPQARETNKQMGLHQTKKLCTAKEIINKIYFILNSKIKKKSSECSYHWSQVGQELFQVFWLIWLWCATCVRGWPRILCSSYLLLLMRILESKINNCCEGQQLRPFVSKWANAGFTGSLNLYTEGTHWYKGQWGSSGHVVQSNKSFLGWEQITFWEKLSPCYAKMHFLATSFIDQF